MDLNQYMSYRNLSKAINAADESQFYAHLMQNYCYVLVNQSKHQNYKFFSCLSGLFISCSLWFSRHKYFM